MLCSTPIRLPQLLLLTLLFAATISFAEGKLVTGCQNKRLSLTCQFGQVIRIRCAVYGPAPRGKCGAHGGIRKKEYSTQSCEARKVTRPLGQFCDGKRQCVLSIEQIRIDRLCRRDQGYTKLLYSCEKDQCSSVRTRADSLARQWEHSGRLRKNANRVSEEIGGILANHYRCFRCSDGFRSNKRPHFHGYELRFKKKITPKRPWHDRYQNRRNHRDRNHYADEQSALQWRDSWRSLNNWRHRPHWDIKSEHPRHQRYPHRYYYNRENSLGSTHNYREWNNNSKKHYKSQKHRGSKHGRKHTDGKRRARNHPRRSPKVDGWRYRKREFSSKTSEHSFKHGRRHRRLTLTREKNSIKYSRTHRYKNPHDYPLRKKGNDLSWKNDRRHHKKNTHPLTGSNKVYRKKNIKRYHTGQHWWRYRDGKHDKINGSIKRHPEKHYRKEKRSRSNLRQKQKKIKDTGFPHRKSRGPFGENHFRGNSRHYRKPHRSHDNQIKPGRLQYYFKLDKKHPRHYKPTRSHHERQEKREHKKIDKLLSYDRKHKINHHKGISEDIQLNKFNGGSHRKGNHIDHHGPYLKNLPKHSLQTHHLFKIPHPSHHDGQLKLHDQLYLRFPSKHHNKFRHGDKVHLSAHSDPLFGHDLKKKLQDKYYYKEKKSEFSHGNSFEHKTGNNHDRLSKQNSRHHIIPEYKYRFEAHKPNPFHRPQENELIKKVPKRNQQSHRKHFENGFKFNQKPAFILAALYDEYHDHSNLGHDIELEPFPEHDQNLEPSFEHLTKKHPNPKRSQWVGFQSVEFHEPKYSIVNEENDLNGRDILSHHQTIGGRSQRIKNSIRRSEEKDFEFQPTTDSD